MFLEEAIKKILAANQGVTTLVQGRVYPGTLPQTCQYPAIAYRVVYREHVEHIEGESGQPRASSGLGMSRIRFFSAAKGPGSYGEAKRLDRAIRLAIQGYQAIVTSDDSPIDTIDIQGISAKTTFDAYDDKTQTYQTISDFEAWSNEPQPITS